MHTKYRRIPTVTYGVDSKNTTFIDQTHSIHFDMMEKGELDVGFFLYKDKLISDQILSKF